eukprot:Rmarinus@m.11862
MGVEVYWEDLTIWSILSYIPSALVLVGIGSFLFPYLTSYSRCGSFSAWTPIRELPLPWMEFWYPWICREPYCEISVLSVVADSKPIMVEWAVSPDIPWSITLRSSRYDDDIGFRECGISSRSCTADETGKTVLLLSPKKTVQVTESGAVWLNTKRVKGRCTLMLRCFVSDRNVAVSLPMVMQGDRVLSPAFEVFPEEPGIGKFVGKTGLYLLITILTAVLTPSAPSKEAVMQARRVGRGAAGGLAASWADTSEVFAFAAVVVLARMLEMAIGIGVARVWWRKAIQTTGATAMDGKPPCSKANQRFLHSAHRLPSAWNGHPLSGDCHSFFVGYYDCEWRMRPDPRLPSQQQRISHHEGHPGQAPGQRTSIADAERVGSTTTVKSSDTDSARVG